MTKRLTLLTLCLVLITSCAKEPSKAAKRPEGARTKFASQVQEDLEKFQAATGTLRGLAWVELKTVEEDWRTDAAIVVERPAKLRIDVMDTLADVWAKIGSDGKSMWLYVPGKGKLYKGRASSRNMRRLASFETKPADLISFLAGSPPISGGAELLQVGGGRDRHLVDGSSGLSIWVEKGRHRRVSRCVQYGSEDKIDYEIRFSGYRKVGGVDYPHLIEASFPASGARLRLEYKEVSFGGDVSEDIFSPPVRRRGKIVKLKE